MNTKGYLCKVSGLRKVKMTVCFEMKHLNFPEKRNFPDFLSDKPLHYIQPEITNSFSTSNCTLGKLKSILERFHQLC